MKRFLLTISLGVFSFFCVWLLVECIQANTNTSPNRYSKKYNYVKNNPAIKTLLIGHSHFENGINPYLLGDSVFDFAMSGRAWLEVDSKLAEDLFHTMPNLKTVIYPLGYHFPYLYINTKDASTRNELYHYARYMHLKCYQSNVIKDKSSLMHNEMGPRHWMTIECDSLGYHEIVGQSPKWETEHNISPNVIEGRKADSCYNEFKNNLVKLAKICAENSIRFVVVTCPCADCYVANTREKGMQNLYALIDSVSAYYPIEYYNYLNDEEFRADSLYYNSSHLNSIGADKFARRLKKDLGL